MNDSTIRIQQLVRRYPAGDGMLTAVDHISLDIPAGQFVAILGPSGSGKSTLLNLIGGIDQADEGFLSVGKQTVTAMSRRQLVAYRKNTTGFVFQFYNLVDNLTVWENIDVAAALCTDPMPIAPLLAQLGLSEQAKKFPGELSGGQQQRVAIARAMVKRPALLLCDEPTGALDSQSSTAILQLLRQVNRTYGTTVLMITHNTVLGQLADRVIRLCDGRITDDQMNPAVLSAEQIHW